MTIPNPMDVPWIEQIVFPLVGWFLFTFMVLVALCATLAVIGAFCAFVWKLVRR